MEALGRWILERACADAVAWPGEIKVAVNLSPAQFRGGFLFDVIIGVLMTLSGVGILLGNGAARWGGVVFAFLSAMAHFGTISSFPLWGVMVIAIDVTIIYTLTARWMPDF